MKSLFVVVLLLGQLPRDAPNGVITGSVKEYKTTQGIPGVRINVERIAEGSPAVLTVTTDSAGNFSIKDLAFGSYRVSAESDGYSNPLATSGSGSRSAILSTDVTLAVGLSNPPLLMSLTRGGDLTGQILDTDGRPVSNLAVGAYSRNYRYDGAYSFAENYFSVRARSVTDDKGIYRISKLPPGPYYIGANPARGVELSIPPILRTFYPDTLDPDRAIPVQILGGQEVHADIKVPSPKGVTISGSVVYSVPSDVMGLGPLKPTFTVIPRNTTAVVENPRSVADALVVPGQAEAKFELRNILPGSYDLFTVIPSQLRNVFVGRTTVEVRDTSVENVVVRIHSGSQVKIRLVVNGAPSPFSPDKVRPQLRPRENWTIPFDLAMIRPGEAVAPRPQAGAPQPPVPPLVDATGAFSFLYVTEGTYAVEMAGLPEDAYIVDVKQGGFSDESKLLTITNASVEEVQVLISTMGTRVEGDVVASSPASLEGVDVVLVPQGTLRPRNHALYKRIIPDEQGHFVFRGVAPGEYRLYAMNHLPSNAHLNAEFMQQFSSRGTPIVVQGGPVPAIRLRPIEVIP